jgi:RPA family protein
VTWAGLQAKVTRVLLDDHAGAVLVVWRDQAVHAAESLAKGSRVVVVGRLAQRAWQADDGAGRSVVVAARPDRG